jgi:hypothetical protein
MKDTKIFVEDYIQFVDKMIKSYKKIGDLINEDSGEITPEKINSALALYYNTSLAIIAEYQRQKINYEAESIEFKVWEDTRFEDAKRAILEEYADTKIKPSVKEFETRMRIMFADEWKEKTLSLTEAEARMRFMLHLSDNLQKYDGILTTISYNMRAEMKSLSLDSRMNAAPEGVTRNKIRDRFPVVNRVKEE